MCAIEVKIMAGGCAVNQRPISLIRGKEGIDWGLDPSKATEVWAKKSTWPLPHGKQI